MITIIFIGDMCEYVNMGGEAEGVNDLTNRVQLNCRQSAYNQSLI